MTETKQPFKLNLSMIKAIDFQEKVGQKDPWVNWGNRNDFPDSLIHLMCNSALHHNILEKRSQMICGDGITIAKTSQKNLKATEQFLANVNHYGETMDELLEKISLDYATFNCSAIEVRWGRGANRISEIIHIPMDKIRIGVKDRLGNIESYFYTDNWKLCRKDDYKPIPMTPFTTIKDKTTVDASTYNQVMLIKKYSVGQGYYSQPEYVGGLNYISLDYQMSEFANSYIVNGYNPGVVISIKNVSDEDKEFITNQFINDQTGARNSGKPVFIFPDDGADIKIDSINTQQFDTLIAALDALATKNILQAHGMPGILVGIAESGKLGDSQEINNAYLEFEASKIYPAQNAILTRLNKLLKINGLDDISISSSTPIPFTADEETMKSCLTVNEMREALGYGELPDDQYKNIVDNAAGKGGKGAEPTTPEAKPKKTIQPKQ